MSEKQSSIHQFFKLMVEKDASDLHITIGSYPKLRIDGELLNIKTKKLDISETKRMIYQILSKHQQEDLERDLGIDFSFEIRGLARFRGNVFHARGGVCGVFRLIPSTIPDFEVLNLPKILLEITKRKSGLILVTGETGSGKSTTLASLLDYLNSTLPSHIITLEDPVEFSHEHKKGIVNQREIGRDALDFHRALKHLLRQDPDIVLIGEMRDRETIEAALTVAETGHLTFGTLHTNSCVDTISRLIDTFPSDQQSQIRSLLSFVLQGVVSQRLIPKASGRGRVAAFEILIPTSGIRNLIRENKVHQVYSQMQIGQEKTGMITMNQSLAKLVANGTISEENALKNSTMLEELKQQLFTLKR